MTRKEVIEDGERAIVIEDGEREVRMEKNHFECYKGTVAELIEWLQTLPQDAVVTYDDDFTLNINMYRDENHLMVDMY